MCLLLAWFWYIFLGVKQRYAWSHLLLSNLSVIKLLAPPITAHLSGWSPSTPQRPHPSDAPFVADELLHRTSPNVSACADLIFATSVDKWPPDNGTKPPSQERHGMPSCTEGSQVCVFMCKYSLCMCVSLREGLAV